MGSDKKWIYLSYIVITFLCAWVLNQVAIVVITYLRLPNPKLLGTLPAATVASFAIMAVAAFVYFRQEKVNAFAAETMQELHKVTWPPRKNAWLSTVVVIISVFIMSVILGIFDWFCSGLIRFVLRV